MVTNPAIIFHVSLGNYAITLRFTRSLSPFLSLKSAFG